MVYRFLWFIINDQSINYYPDLWSLESSCMMNTQIYDFYAWWNLDPFASFWGENILWYTIRKPMPPKRDWKVTGFWYEDGNSPDGFTCWLDQLRQNRPSKPLSLSQAWSVHGEVWRYDLPGEKIGQRFHVYWSNPIHPSSILSFLGPSSWVTKPQNQGFVGR